MMQKAYSIIGYTADSAIYCPDCAMNYFVAIHTWKFFLGLLSVPRDEHGIPETIKDQSGNEAGVIFACSEPADYPETCCTCHHAIRD